jgi:hypothetical protein
MRASGIVYEKTLSGHAERRLSVLLAPNLQAPLWRRAASVYSDDVARMLLDSYYSGSCSGDSTFVALKERCLAQQRNDTRKLNLSDADISSFFFLLSSTSSFPWIRPL